ncbi:T9SS type A sorting domain-containing protein [Flavobacterium sp. GN10]|uniref:T9SS type A sorting domain-containing protein n=1 Tax=Flavobacterium tagetis TaxID=2801336 RepID=A0ABS1KC06_9FLAO|nr:T9SS type A sorting domain-containing protein [Flavobacterium tagetis]MBL0737024.1 T9SS type A sorting domain-containing protein [Flavobacterium tagetis]
MKKNYLFLIATLMLNALMFAQTVTLTPTAVNNTNVNSGPINLASVPTSTVSLNIKVEIPSNVAVNDQGTITVYYSNLSTTNANVAAGGNGGNLYFGSGRTAVASIIINLYWSDFLTSGGFIFAEYKTSAGTSYRSSNLAVIKNPTLSEGTTLNPPADAPNPTKIVNTLCCNQTVRLGERPQPITGSQFLNPYAREPYGINTKWETNGTPRPPAITNLDNTNQSLTLDYTTALGSFTVKRSLGYVYGNQYPNTSNTISITVIKSPMSENTISIDGPFDSNGFAEIITSNPKIVSGSSPKINLALLQNPNHTEQRGDNVVDVDRYEWEYTKTNLIDWKTLENENSPTLNNFIPNDLEINEDNYYLIRRIAVYQNIKKGSNELKILVRTIRYNNTICCDQTLKISSPTQIESPESLNSSSIIFDPNIVTPHQYYISYQWQLQLQGNRTSDAWQNITGATNKDYMPTQSLEIISDPRRNTLKLKESYNYRRIAQVIYSGYDENNKWVSGTVKSYSNEIYISSTTFNSKLMVYPNPASTTLNIEHSSLNLTNSTIKIIDAMGKTVNPNSFSILSPSLATIDISNLLGGIYFITLQTSSYSIQLNFIKN